jgi:flagellar basal-body rod modification protein FlgD
MTTTSATSASANDAIIAAINGTSSSTKSTTSAVQNMQNQFLTLLTTQLQNQDPTNPMDNSQMTSQLAQISTVQGITQLNASLQTLLSNLTASQAVQAANLVGHGVMVPGNALTLTSGTPALAALNLDSAASNVTVTITDASGATVRTLNLGSLKAGLSDFQWDGTTNTGATAAAGNYKYSVNAANGSTAVNATALQLGVVNSVTLASTGTLLNLGSAGTASISSVQQII